MSKMVMAIVPREQVECVLSALIEAGYTATYSESRGGVLRQSQETLYCVVEVERLDHVLALIRDNCRIESPVTAVDAEHGETARTTSVTAILGGAVVFVWEIERVEKY